MVKPKTTKPQEPEIELYEYVSKDDISDAIKRQGDLLRRKSELQYLRGNRNSFQIHSWMGLNMRIL